MFSYAGVWDDSSGGTTEEEDFSRDVSDSEENVISETLVAKKRHLANESFIPRKKGKPALQWPKKAITTLLELRLKENRHFEVDSRDADSVAWEIVAAALKPIVPCSAHECRLLFESLITKFVLLRNQGKANAWEHNRIFEELFGKSQKLAECYPKLPHIQIRTDLVRENVRSADERSSAVLESLISYRSELSLYQSYALEFQNKTRERAAELERVARDLKTAKEKNVLLLYKILKKITQRNNSDGNVLSRLILKVIPGFLSGSSFCIPIIGNYLQNSSFDRDISKSVSLFSSALVTSTRLLFNENSEEDEFYFKLWSRLDFNSSLRLNDLRTQASLSEFNFKGHLHLCRTTVENLIKIVGPKLRNEKYTKPMSVEKQTIFALWYLIHKEASEQMSIRFSMRLSDVGKVIRTFVNAVASEFTLSTWLEGEGELEKTVKAFENQRKDAFPGVLGAIGSKYLVLSADETLGFEVEDDPNQHIVVQAVADSNYIINNLFVSWLDGLDSDDNVDLELNPLGGKRRKITPKDVFLRSPLGSSIAWQTNHLNSTGKPLKSLSIPNAVHLIGDHTYPLLMSLMVPFGGTDQGSPSQYLFDIELHLSRSVIDSTFGRIMNRFQRLSCLDYNLKSHTFDLIKTCIAVHNICMREGDDFAPTKISLPEIDNFAVDREIVPIAAAKRNKLCRAFQDGNIPYVYRSTASST